MNGSGYLRTKRLAKWVCLVTWEQSLLFDEHVRLSANKARVYMKMSGYLDCSSLLAFTTSHTWTAKTYRGFSSARLKTNM
jgi:hypothetical protein